MTSTTLVQVFILALPILLGTVVGMWKPPRVEEWLHRFGQWLERRRTTIQERRGWWNRLFSRPAYWLFTRVGVWTRGITDTAVRSGVQVAAYLYVGSFVAWMALFAAYLIVAAVMFLLAAWALSWILRLMSGDPPHLDTRPAAHGSRPEVRPEPSKTADSATDETRRPISTGDRAAYERGTKEARFISDHPISYLVSGGIASRPSDPEKAAAYDKGVREEQLDADKKH
jgi:hypothetical protein